MAALSEMTRRTGVLLAGLTALAAGCGNAVDARVDGIAGVAVDGSGRPVVLVAPCSTRVDLVVVSGSREGLRDDEPNPTLLSLRATEPRTETFTVDLEDPGPGWTADGDLEVAGAAEYVVTASDSSADSEVTQVSFRGRDLRGLGTGVVVRDREVVPRSEFDARACD